MRSYIIKNYLINKLNVNPFFPGPPYELGDTPPMPNFKQEDVSYLFYINKLLFRKASIAIRIRYYHHSQYYNFLYSHCLML